MSLPNSDLLWSLGGRGRVGVGENQRAKQEGRSEKKQNRERPPRVKIRGKKENMGKRGYLLRRSSSNAKNKDKGKDGLIASS